MSVWSKFTGTVTFPNVGHGCSIKKLLDSLTSEIFVLYLSRDGKSSKIEATFSLDGQEAVKLVNDFMEALKSFKAKVDLCLEARFTS